MAVSQTTPTDNRTGIETNINTEFSVYPTSGLLFNYPNAHAAYSLRQLQNLQTYAIRIQRHVAPFDTLDIGFDGSGGLDTAAITTFAGSDVCGVETWYDQQHNSSKDITQALTSNQPLIFDGSSVYLVNGKPAIYYDTSVKQLSCPLYLGSGAQCDILNVHQRVSGVGYFLHWEGAGGFQVIDMRTVNYDMGWLGGTVGGAYGTTQNLMTAITNGSAGQFRINGVAGSVGTLDANRKFNSEFAIQGRPGFPGSNPGPVIYQQEFIQYDFNNTSGDLSSIETNVNAYYSIYP